MRITVSARAWMLSAATGMVMLPSSLTFADAPRVFNAQRQPASAESGTARPEDEAKAEGVQSQLNRIYSRFPSTIRSTKESAPILAPASAPAELIAKSATKAKDTSSAAKQAVKDTKSTAKQVAKDATKVTESGIRQASNEVPQYAGTQEPGMLSDSAVGASRPARPVGDAVKPAVVRQVAGTVPGVAQSAPNSEVQRKLDELYRKNGREMPSMQMQDLPDRNLKQKLPPLPQQPAGAQTSQPVAQNRVSNFFKSISPFKKSANDERPAHIEKLSGDQLRQQQQLNQPYSNSQNTAPGAFNPGSAGLIPPPPVAPPAELSETPRLLPSAQSKLPSREIGPASNNLPEFRPIVQLPPGAPSNPPKLPPLAVPERQPMPEVAKPQPEANPVPQLSDAVTDTPFTGENTVKKPVDPVSTDPLADDLGNPFPELSEAEADGKKPTTPKATVTNPPKLPELEAQPATPKTDVEDNPFTGLKLDAAPTLPETNSSQPPLLPTPSSAKPAPFKDDDEDDDEDDEEMDSKRPAGNPQDEKLRKIAERAELRGFKGFCPVTLRDQRDLADARPQFKSAFQGKIYHFSTEAARDKFEKSPKLYAPVAGGNDVVASKSEDSDVEGSLDYAVWFRDRLYLFSSVKTKAVFEESPTQYVTE